MYRPTSPREPENEDIVAPTASAAQASRQERPMSRARRIELLREEAAGRGGRAESFRVDDEGGLASVSIVTFDQGEGQPLGGWLVADEGTIDLSGHLMVEAADPETGAFAGYRPRRLRLREDPHVAVARLDDEARTVLAVRAHRGRLSYVTVDCAGPATAITTSCGQSLVCISARGGAERTVAVESPDGRVVGHSECSRHLDAIGAAASEAAAARRAALRAVLGAPAGAPACEGPGDPQRRVTLAALRLRFRRAMIDRGLGGFDLGQALDAFDRAAQGLEWGCLDRPSRAFLVSGGVEEIDPPFAALWRVAGSTISEVYSFDLARLVDSETQADLTGDGIPETLYRFHARDSGACTWEVVSPSWERPAVVAQPCPDRVLDPDAPYVAIAPSANGSRAALVVGGDVRIWGGRAFIAADSGFDALRAALAAARQASDAAHAIAAAVRLAPRGAAPARQACSDPPRAAWAARISQLLREAGIPADRAAALAAAPVGLSGCGDRDL
ncbi:MAG: hypothetical protein HYY06_07145 [Deltaproteobacteria bacterium]|nr:hypothetical protein [Deltaproteobacteria bacterium]